MKQRTAHLAAIMMIVILSLPEQSNSQTLEVDGQVKIADTPTDNAADQVVVKQADGTLAVRDAASLLAVGTGNYGTVVNPVTGKVWLDRNLGASQVATSSTDTASYGDLYQWGRAADGHQVRSSATDNTQATFWLADEGNSSWDGKFVIGSNNWLSTGETDLWSGTAAENNPCPTGFRIPTNAEWNQERLSWSTNDAAGAFASALKLPLAGGRKLVDGLFLDFDTVGRYWSSTVSGDIARYLFFVNDGAFMNQNPRAFGFAVRCIKD